MTLFTLILFISAGAIPSPRSDSDPVVFAAKSRSAGRGQTHFENYCASCHQSDGRGVEGEGPPLAGSSWVAGPQTRLIKIVMHGMRGQVTVGGKTFNREMAGFAERLSDSEIASLLSFVRRKWATGKQPVKSITVGRVRYAFRNRKDYWSVEELLRDP